MSKCGQETEIFSRVTGYYRPIKNWNKGKSAEFKERRVYKISGKKGEEKPCTKK